MKKILHFFILITILTFNNVFSQATPYVDVIPPVAVCNSGDCVDLLADYLETEITNTYRVESIPYLPPATFTPLSDSFVFDSSQDDRWSTTFNLPFDFCFYGQFYNQVLVGSNGLITFDLVNQASAGFCQWSYNQTIPNATFPIRNAIYGVYQDTNINQPPVLNPTVQNVNYRIFGTAPTRKFVVSYNELPQYSCNDGVGRQTSQIVIYETSNVIEVYVARRTACVGWNGGRGVIGVQNDTGTLATFPANRNTGTWTATNEAWRFVPDGGVINSQISWLANGTLIPGSVGQNPINVCPTVNTDYTAVISYTECDATIKRISETITIGPEVFPLIEPQDITICTSGPPPYTFDIDQGDYMEGGTQSGNYGYSYYNSLSDAQNFVSPIDPTTLNTYQSNGGETIWVAVEDYLGGCVFFRSFDLLAIASPSGDITYSSPSYCSNDTNLYTPTNTAPSGGQYIVTPATGLSIDTVTGEINPSLSTEGSYSIVYHLDATATCPAYDTPPYDLDIINCDCSLVLTSAANTDNQVICISDAITPIEYTVGGVATGANVTGLPAGVSAIFSGGVVTISGTPTVTGTYNYDVETVGCSSNLILSGSITISPAPVLTSLTGNGPICEGEDAIFTIVGTPNATISYSLDGGATTQTVVLDASGNGQVIVTAAAVDQTIDLSQIAIGSCVTPLTATETIVVNPLPSVTSVTGNGPICEGEDAIFDIVGTADATVSYSLDGGTTTQTVVLDASGNGQVIVTAATVDQTITLSLIENTTTTCSLVVTNTETIVVNPLPVLTSLTGNGPICEGEDAIFTIVGTPNATISYSLDGGTTTQTVVLDASGNGQVVLASATVNQTINLTQITNGGCITPLTVTETIVVNPLPTVTSLNGNGPICYGQDAVFTITGTAGAQVTYTLNSVSNTVTIPASGSATVTVLGATVNQTITLSQITYTTTITCSANLNNTATVSIIALPTASIDAQSNTVCNNRNTTLLFNGTPNATVTFTNGTANYTVTLNASGNATYTTPNLTADTTYTITNVTTGTTPSCSQTVIDFETITITPTPTATVTYTNTICAGTATDFVITLNNTTTYVWNATITNIDNTTYVQSGNETDNINQIVNLQNILNVGYITMQITPTLSGSSGSTCNGESTEYVVTVTPVPVITDIAIENTTVCSGEAIHLEVSGNLTNVNYNWTAILNGVVIASGTTTGTTTSDIDMIVEVSDMNQSGDLYFEITPVLGSCTGQMETSDVITVNPIPGAVVSSPDANMCSGESVADVVDIQIGTPTLTGTTVEWVVQSVTGVDGANSGSSSTAPFEIPDILTTTSNAQGVVVYRVWSISSTGCRGAYTDFTIYVNPLPDPILEDGSICIELATGAVFQSHLLDSGIANTSDYQFTWYFNGNVISGATQSTYEAEVAGDYYVLVQNTITNCENISNIVTVTEINNATDFTYTITDAFSDNATVSITVIDGNGNYSYQLDDQNLQSSNVFTGISSGTHQLTVVDEKGCTYLTKEIFIIDYPKFFTPNGDGYNDYWNIFTLRDQPNAKIHIFDRYGKLIKEISPLGTGWDGTFNSKDLPSTDYWFTVEYEENQQQKVFKAHFSLKR